MSLHHLASHLAQHGRNGDSVLVHMTPEEVHGLQALALAHGGTLTINPHTGLPEASFLKKLLPMLSGALLTFFSGGALSPLAAGMMTGAGTGLITGDWKRGLLAGFGAYGGAGLGNALMKAGAPAVSQVAQTEAQKAFLAQQNESAITKGLFDKGLQGAVTSTPTLPGQTAITKGMFDGGLKSAASYSPHFAGQTAISQGALDNALSGVQPFTNAAPAATPYSLNALGQGLSNAGSGIMGLINGDPTITNAIMTNANKKYLLASLAGAAASGKKKDAAATEPEHYVTRYHPGTVNPNWQQPGNTQPYFIGQGYDTGITTKEDPYKAMQNLATPAGISALAPTSPLQYFSPEGVRPYYAGAAGGEISSNPSNPTDDVSDVAYADGGSTSLQSYFDKLNSSTGPTYTPPPPKKYIDTTPYEGVVGGSAGMGTNMSGYMPDLPAMAYGTMPDYVHGSNTMPPWVALGQGLAQLGHNFANSASNAAHNFADTVTHPVAHAQAGLTGLKNYFDKLVHHPIDTAISTAKKFIPFVHDDAQPTPAQVAIGGGGGPSISIVGNGTAPVTYGGGGQQSVPGGSVTSDWVGGNPLATPSDPNSGHARGGPISDHDSLGHYSDGGRLLRGPGDGVSDDIPARIHRDDGTQHEARLADGEFVFPARIVSEIGNGSTEAGAQKLYAIMDKIQQDRARSIKNVALDSNAERHFNSLTA